jgi:hypothetical protein
VLTNLQQKFASLDVGRKSTQMRSKFRILLPSTLWLIAAIAPAKAATIQALEADASTIVAKKSTVKAARIVEDDAPAVEVAPAPAVAAAPPAMAAAPPAMAAAPTVEVSQQPSAAVAVASAAAPASPVQTQTATFSPTPSNLNDLDHHLAYTWQISGGALNNINFAGGAIITSATLTFTNIRNWDSGANMLFVHLLDTARYSGVNSFTDASGSPVTVIHDNFANPYLHGAINSNPDLRRDNPLITAGTGNTSATGNKFLFQQSFTTSPTNYTFTFTAADLAILTSYITNGRNIAFGLDPDCHYFNNGICFTITWNTPVSVPETGGTLGLLGAALIAVEIARRKCATTREKLIRPN